MLGSIHTCALQCSCLKAQSQSALHCFDTYRSMPPKTSKQQRNKSAPNEKTNSSSAKGKSKVKDCQRSGRARKRDESGGGNKHRCRKRYFMRLLKRKVKEAAVGADDLPIKSFKEAETQFEYFDSLKALAMYRGLSLGPVAWFPEASSICAWVTFATHSYSTFHLLSSL